MVLSRRCSSDDLKDRGFSVDRPTLTPLSVLTHRVDNQRAKNPEKRELPKYSRLFYFQLKEDWNAEGQHYFEVQPSPVLESVDMPGNPGHASIYSDDKKLGNGGLRKVRTALIEHFNNVVELVHTPTPAMQRRSNPLLQKAS